MDDSLISLFIDDEMDLDEKIVFVETVHTSREFSLEAVALLELEKRLQAMPAPMPSTVTAAEGQQEPSLSWWLRFSRWWQPVAGFATALLLMGLLFSLMPGQPVVSPAAEQRFVLYLPQAKEAKIIGTFTDWNPVPLRKIGASGYWSLTLKVPQGQHRYSYLVEEDTRMVDPTVAAREHDDFGGENSVIVIGGGDDPLS